LDTWKVSSRFRVPEYNAASEKTMSTDDSKPAKILVVEDNPADIAWLSYSLDQFEEPYGLEVLRDGEEALRFVAEHRAGAREPDPCVILLDLHLPKHDGIEVLRAIKREPMLAHIHVVLVTTLLTPRDEAAIMALGGLCRAKPSTLDQCLALAGEVLAICRGPKSTVLA
jgi:CheY-like chemotaxis protein